MTTNTNIRFKSVLNPDKYGFIFEHSSTEHWDMCYHTANLLSYHTFYYATFGDGQTQHSGLSPVTADEMAVDYLLSLAQHLVEHPEEFHYSLESMFGHSLPSRAAVQFLDSLKETSGYFSLGEYKSSKSPAKQYDKRWTAVTPGSFALSYRIDRIFDLFLSTGQGHSRNKLELIGVLLAIADGLDDCYISFAQSERLNQWLSEDVLAASKALWQTVKALRAMAYAGQVTSAQIGNFQRAKEAKSQVAA